MKAFFLQIIFSSASGWVPMVVLSIVIAYSGYAYLYAGLPVGRLRVLFVRLIAATVAFRVAFAGLLTGAQYYAWSQDPMGKLLLPPAQGISVFLRYAWTHFWINVLISFGVGLFMFVLLRALQKKNERFFDAGEVELGTLLAFVVGWPHFVVFLPLAFVCVVVISIVRGIIWKEPYTTLGIPLIVASAIALWVALPALRLARLAAWII